LTLFFSYVPPLEFIPKTLNKDLSHGYGQPIIKTLFIPSSAYPLYPVNQSAKSTLYCISRNRYQAFALKSVFKNQLLLRFKNFLQHLFGQRKKQDLSRELQKRLLLLFPLSQRPRRDARPDRPPTNMQFSRAVNSSITKTEIHNEKNLTSFYLFTILYRI